MYKEIIGAIVIRYKEWKLHMYYRRKAKKLNRAKRLADLRCKMNNKIYYVLEDWLGEYQVVNSAEIKYLKLKKRMDRRVNSYHLLKEAEYIVYPKKKKA